MKILINEKISPHRYKDNHGYLICTDCIMARTGKQTYTRDECFGDGDSTEIEVDRPSKEVFDAKTMASFENVPITIEHPSVNVDPDNYNTLSVGHMRDIRKGMYEGQPVMVGTAVITDSEAIEKVESGELTNLSCGYDCDIDDSDNPHQFNIRGNHIALCESPRAGITHIQDSLRKDRIRMPKKRVVARRTKDEADYDVIYVELKNGKFKPYEFDTSEETREEAVRNIVEQIGDEVSVIYGEVSNAGPFDILYVNETEDSERKVVRPSKKLRNDSRRPKMHKYIVTIS